MRPPLAKEKEHVSTWHGENIIDPFFWLRAQNWQEVMRDPESLDPEIKSYLEDENAFTDYILSDTKDLQKTLYEEMKARLKPDDSTVPLPDGPFEYFSNFIGSGQYPRFCRKQRDGKNEIILLDGNKEAQGKKYWDLGGVAHSPNHDLIAFSIDDQGSELFTIRIRNILTGHELNDKIENTRGEIVWGNDSHSLYYIRVDTHHRPKSVWRHILGTASDKDELIYEEKDDGFYISLSKTQSRRYILINAHDHETTEFRYLDANDVQAKPQIILERLAGHEYDVEHHGDFFIITTNSENAEDFRIIKTPILKTSKENWSEILPHKIGRLIIDVSVTLKHLIRLERENGLPRIVVREFATGSESPIEFPEEAYALGLINGYEYETNTIRFTYSSMTTPAETYDYDMVSKTRVLKKRQEIPTGHNTNDYVTRRLFALATDGEEIPVSILYKKGTSLDGTAPLLLYGYGAYGISMPASFSTGRLSLVDRGFVYAIAHIRGGKEKGYRWYKMGKTKKKKNTFTDYIAAAEMLISKKFTSRGRIIANGGSAGGMLMGAVTNLRPDLFLGIIADVPFVDVLNTMLDKDLPLTPPEWPEWGNPLQSKADFETIRSYSPYDNVENKSYPHILATGGLSDPRVLYWEPAKWIAKLRRCNNSNNLILLKINMSAGHGGASGRYERLKETARDYAFAIKISKVS
ncbi:MAG: S9 family peptidase [Hyphomicrobium sp.]